MVIRTGAATRCYRGMSSAEAAALMKRDGFTCTEICFSQTDCDLFAYNGRGDIDSLGPGRAKEIADTYRAAGVEPVALGVFGRLTEPDAAENEANLEYFRKYIDLAASCGIPYVATECGFDAARRGLALDTYESVFERMLSNVRQLAGYAAGRGVGIAIEPCVLDVIPSAKRMADFLSQCGADNAGVLLDPANLIANSSEEDMFRYLRGRIRYFHGKDRRVNDAKGRFFGDGEVDWIRFARLYGEQTPDTPFIFEYVTPENAKTAAGRLADYVRKASEQKKAPGGADE